MSRSLRALARGGVFALLLTVACGGGGGDGGGGGSSGPVTLLDSYLFRIADTASHPPFAVAFTETTGDHKVVISHQNPPGSTAVTGAFATNTHEWTFDAGAEWQIDTNQGSAPLLGGFVLGFDTAVVVPPDGPPTAGSISIDAGSFEAQLTFGASGISMSVDGGAAVLYTWSAFEDLMEDPTATPQERIAAFGIQVVRFMIERYEHVIDLILQLVDVSDLEEGYNPRTTQGVSWPSGYAMVPATMDNPGFGSLGWNDRDFSEGVNSGDDLSWGLWDCRPYTDVEWMYDGGTTFQNLVESVDGSSTVQSVGFAPSGGREGGVFHDGMHIEEMEVDDGAMTVSVDSTLILSGAFTFVLTAP